MGWTNFIVVDKLKLVVEISRHLNELDRWKKTSLDKIIDDYVDENEFDVMYKKLDDMDLESLGILLRAFKEYTNLSCIDYPAEFFLYWLESRNIDYKIMSEYEIKLEKFKNHTILRL